MILYQAGCWCHQALKRTPTQKREQRNRNINIYATALPVVPRLPSVSAALRLRLDSLGYSNCRFWQRSFYNFDWAPYFSSNEQLLAFVLRSNLVVLKLSTFLCESKLFHLWPSSDKNRNLRSLNFRHLNFRNLNFRNLNSEFLDQNNSVLLNSAYK